MYCVMNIGRPNQDNNEVVPQVMNMGPGYNWDAADSITALSTNAPLSVSPNFHAFHLDPETRLTDVISQAYIFTRGILISERFWRTLEGFVTQAHQSYAADVVFRGKTSPYYWLHMTEELENRIDYANSDFYIEPTLGGAAESVTLADRQALDALSRRLVDEGIGSLRPRRITFVSGTPAYDLFCLQFTSCTFFASARLADRLSADKLTGLEFRSAQAEFVFFRQ
jgi:hypothetical protein